VAKEIIEVRKEMDNKVEGLKTQTNSKFELYDTYIIIFDRWLYFLEFGFVVIVLAIISYLLYYFYQKIYNVGERMEDSY
jgi:hypothetical protein